MGSTGSRCRGVRASPACHLKNRWLTATTCLPYPTITPSDLRARQQYQQGAAFSKNMIACVPCADFSSELSEVFWVLPATSSESIDVDNFAVTTPRAPRPMSAATAPAAATGPKGERDEARDRRATRKAAAACLARQRHKHFVNGLHDAGSTLRQRVHILRARKGHAVRKSRAS